jgi:hypothetical protein
VWRWREATPSPFRCSLFHPAIPEFPPYLGLYFLVLGPQILTSHHSQLVTRQHHTAAHSSTPAHNHDPREANFKKSSTGFGNTVFLTFGRLCPDVAALVVAWPPGWSVGERVPSHQDLNFPLLSSPLVDVGRLLDTHGEHVEKRRAPLTSRASPSGCYRWLSVAIATV